MLPKYCIRFSNANWLSARELLGSGESLANSQPIMFARETVLKGVTSHENVSLMDEDASHEIQITAYITLIVNIFLSEVRNFF